MGNTEMIKFLEEQFKKTHEKIDKIEQELKRLKEEERANNPENEEENSQIMQNDLIFTSAGELLNQTDEK